MIEHTIRIRAEWDPEAGVYVATTDDMVGLVAESETLDGLATKLQSLVPEMLNLNGLPDLGIDPMPDRDAPFELVAQSKTLAPAHC